MSKKQGKIGRLIETATDLFMRFGVKRVSVEEICKTANVSKMTFYKHFSNKTELAKYILDDISNSQMVQYNKIMKQDTPFYEKVKQIIDMKLHYNKHISSEFMKELLTDENPELKVNLQFHTQKSYQVVMNDFVKVQQKGEIRQDIKPEFILYMLHHVIEMYSDERLASMYPSPRELNLELLNFFFYGLLPPEKREQ